MRAIVRGPAQPEIHSCRGTETVERGSATRRGRGAPGSALFGALRRHRRSTEVDGPRSAVAGNGNCGFPAQHASGSYRVPGDKSISHRALVLAALADGVSEIVGLAPGADVQSTARCLRALGITIDIEGNTTRVHGRGIAGLRAPTSPLDCGNSGTTMRMLSGVLAGAGIEATLIGDASLSRRPMERVARPLAQMGVQIETTNGHAPIRIRGRATRAITWESAPPSAQVKTCVLLAGLFCDGETHVHESLTTRDHTERLLPQFGVAATGARVRGPAQLHATRIEVPGDFSSAAFLLGAALATNVSGVSVTNVGINPTRTGLLDAFRALGVSFSQGDVSAISGEPTATVRCAPSTLRAANFQSALVARAIDEIPLLAVLCTFANGTSELRGAAELRVKESDRLALVARGLAAMGATVDELPDGLRITGGRALHGTTIDSGGDHRIAMSFAIAGLAAKGETIIDGAEWADISYPGFWTTLGEITRGAVRVDT